MYGLFVVLGDQCEFNCGGNECIRRKQVCDSYSDCSNGKDEIGCGKTLRLTVERSTVLITFHFLDRRPYGRCFSKEFSCVRRCIDLSRVCDGTVDCDDQSDEAAALCLLSGKVTVIRYCSCFARCFFNLSAL